MAEINYEALEAAMAKARRRSWLRFILFLVFILALWLVTYAVTKGQFSFFVKKIAVTDTLVIDQSAALAARDSTIGDMKKLNAALQDSITKLTKYVPAPVRQEWHTNPVDLQNNEVNKLRDQIRLRAREQQTRDSLIRLRQQQAYPDNPKMNLEQGVIKK